MSEPDPPPSPSPADVPDPPPADEANVQDDHDAANVSGAGAAGGMRALRRPGGGADTVTAETTTAALLALAACHASLPLDDEEAATEAAKVLAISFKEACPTEAQMTWVDFV